LRVSFLLLIFVKRFVMPELFRQYGFVFLFFSKEHEPIHVHVRGHDGDAKFNWDGEGFVMEYVHNIKANDLKRIERMIAENTDIIINRWYELFKTADEDDK